MQYTAADLMRRDPITVHEDTDLRDLAKLFLQKAITGAPVVDDDGNMVGVVSQTDLIYYSLTRDDELRMTTDFYHAVRVEGQHLQPGFQIEDVNTGKASDVMTPLVHSVTEAASLDSVARLMTRRHIHRVIVRKGRKATGIISALDVLRVLLRGSVLRGIEKPEPRKRAARPGATRRKAAAPKRPSRTRKAAAKRSSSRRAR